MTLNYNQKKYILFSHYTQDANLKKIGHKDLVFSNYIVFILYHKLICQTLSLSSGPWLNLEYSSYLT